MYFYGEDTLMHGCVEIHRELDSNVSIFHNKSENIAYSSCQLIIEILNVIFPNVNSFNQQR